MLISGGQQGLDIADMRAHVQYSGGYHEEHPVILEFWRALATFSPQEQADFLRFVTSCPRPPLLGFRCAGGWGGRAVCKHARVTAGMHESSQAGSCVLSQTHLCHAILTGPTGTWSRR
jgi:hypothetical protein